MDIRDAVIAKLKQLFPRIRRMSTTPLIFHIGRAKLNVRTATEKAGDKYWFDVTPSLYERNRVAFFLYACGSADHVYVIPTGEFRALIQGASLGGQKQVPNFTIYLDRNELEPAGHAERRQSIARYRNNFELIAAAV